MGMLKNPPMEDQADQGETQEGPETQQASPEEMQQFDAYVRLAKSIVYGRAGPQLAQMMEAGAKSQTLPQSIAIVTTTTMNVIEQQQGPIEDDDMGVQVALEVASMVAHDCERAGLAQGLTEEIKDPQTGETDRLLTDAAAQQIVPMALQMWQRTHADTPAQGQPQGQPQAAGMPAQMMGA